METIKSEGKCLYCGKTYSKQGISRHLETHLKKLKPDQGRQAYHLRVDASPYYLNLLVDGKTKLSDLDDFLRAIWLECCGHMSQFSYERWAGELDMNNAVRRVFEKGSSLWYAYDFGSTTELTVKCVGVYSLKVEDDILLLSRNEPLQITCEECNKKPAVKICTVHWGQEPAFFCEGCAEVHLEECEEADYAMYDVVNSPRMGVCGYTGGAIDVERDRA